MSYDHASKVGNRADVWKHFILLTVVADMAGEIGQDGRSFTYLDSHCGQGAYRLSPGGAWTSGFEQVVPPPAGLAGHPYFAAVGQCVRPGFVYRGSWLLVADYLAKAGRQADLLLYDVNPDVGHRVQRLGTEHSVSGRRVEFRLGDGFRAVAEAESRDLVFVDPPFMPSPGGDFRCLRVVCQMLADRGTSFLAWYPRLDSSTPDLVGPGVGLELMWGSGGSSFGHGMIGCGMLAGPGAAGCLKERTDDLAALAEHMGVAFSVNG